ncbi:hypothetical protein ACFL0Z_03360 [Patescibacteria group bacterium]
MDRARIVKIITITSLVLALIPVAIAGLMVFSHTDYSPWGAFLDSALEFTMEYGWSWSYWLAIIFGAIAAAGVIASFFLSVGFPPRTIWVMNIFSIIFALIDVLLFYMIYEAGSTIVFVNSIASL